LVLSAVENIKPAKESSQDTFIITGDGRGAYCHFAYPIGGPVAPDNQIGKDSARRGSLAVPYLPDVLSIQLPTGKEAPSPYSVRPTITAVAGMPSIPQNGTRVQMPPLTRASKEQ
jgi:hypothetical protein